MRKETKQLIEGLVYIGLILAGLAWLIAVTPLQK